MRLIDIVREDYNNAPKKEDTLLHAMFHDINFGEELDFLEQAVHMFTKDKDERRRLGVTVGWNLERAESPTIHITLPSEQALNAPIGGNEGFKAPIVNESKGEYHPVFTFDNSVTYNFLITSDNTTEVIIIYNFLKMGFASIHEHLELMCLQNVKFGGEDLYFNEELVPPHIFHRNFNMSFTYDYSVKGLLAREFGTKFIVTGIIEEPAT